MVAAAQILGHYRIEEKVGEGTFGDVWRGVDVRLDRRVALKVMRARVDEDAEAWGRLIEEGRAASALNHPGICATYDIGEEEGTGYIAMEYVEGRPLSDLTSAGPLPPPTAISYGIEIATALAHAHGHSIIHRDLKASNIIITPEGHAKLLDFGLAQRLDAPAIEALSQSRKSLAELGGAAGTLIYMAPELLHGKAATTSSDIWSLGVLLYETLSGRLPFQGQTAFEVSMAIMVEDPPPLDSALPEGLRSLVRKCLEKDPAERPADAAGILAGLEESKAAIADAERNRKARGSRLQVAAASLIALLAIAGVSFAWWQHRANQRPPASVIVVKQTTPPAPFIPDSMTPTSGASPLAGTKTAAAKPPGKSPANSGGHASPAGNPNTDVWVNLKTKVYHCPGTRWYKKTASGQLLKQRQAQLAGYHAASNKACP
jgi:serine/threonine protein kinase